MKSFTAADGSHDTSIHYVVAGPHEQPLCRTADERTVLCKELCRTCIAPAVETHIRVIAYCVDDHWVRAVIQLLRRATLRKHFLDALAHEGSDGRAVRRDLPSLEVVRSAPLVAVSAQLAAVRHCHFAPVELGFAREPVEWHWSSHRVYLGLDEMPGFTRGWLANVLADGQGGWPFAYQHLMTSPEEGEDAVSLVKWIVPILPLAEMSGDPSCLRALRHIPTGETISTPSGTERAFKSLVRQVCRTTGCDVHAFQENPAASRFRLERALLLERLANRKVMSVQELSLRLQCDRSWLYKTRAQCRQQFPDLFGRGDHVQHRSPGDSRITERGGVEAVISKARRGRPNRKS